MKIRFLERLVSPLRSRASQDAIGAATAPNNKVQNFAERKQLLLGQLQELVKTMESVISRAVETEEDHEAKQSELCELSRLILGKTTNLLSFFGSPDIVERAESVLKLFEAAKSRCHEWPIGDERGKYKSNIGERIEDLNHLLHEWYPEVRSELEASRTLLTHSPVR